MGENVASENRGGRRGRWWSAGGIACAVSAAAFALTVAVWIRGYWVADWVGVAWRRAGGVDTVELDSYRGRLVVSLWRFPPLPDLRGVNYAADDPEQTEDEWRGRGVAVIVVGTTNPIFVNVPAPLVAGVLTVWPAVWLWRRARRARVAPAFPVEVQRGDRGGEGVTTGKG